MLQQAQQPLLLLLLLLLQALLVGLQQLLLGGTTSCFPHAPLHSLLEIVLLQCWLTRLLPLWQGCACLPELVQRGWLLVLLLARQVMLDACPSFDRSQHGSQPLLQPLHLWVRAWLQLPPSGVARLHQCWRQVRQARPCKAGGVAGLGKRCATAWLQPLLLAPAYRACCASLACTLRHSML